VNPLDHPPDRSFITAVRFHISVASAVRRATFKE
jgi:hypothetical protein